MVAVVSDSIQLFNLNVHFLPLLLAYSALPVFTVTRYFWCNCSRCSSKHDLARAFRCPFCHKGAVYPATVACQASHTVAVEGESSRAGSNCAAPGTTACESAAVGSAPAVGFEPAFGSQAFGVSACTDCGRVPTASWLASALRLEIFVLQALEETFAFDDSRAAHVMPSLVEQISIVFVRMAPQN